MTTRQERLRETLRSNRDTFWIDPLYISEEFRNQIAETMKTAREEAYALLGDNFAFGKKEVVRPEPKSVSRVAAPTVGQRKLINRYPKNNRRVNRKRLSGQCSTCGVDWDLFTEGCPVCYARHYMRREYNAQREAKMIDQTKKQKIVPGDKPNLSQQQIEVLTLSAAGWNQYRIGDALGISHWTVHDELARIRAKFRVTSTLLAVAQAIRLGFAI